MTRALIVFTLLSTLPSAAEAQIRGQVVASGFTSPLHLVADPLFPNVTYIVEQGGLVHVIEGGVRRAEPFLDLRGVVASGGERGLLGMAFDPNPATGRVFVNFTNTEGNTVIARFRRSAAAPLRADPATRFDLQWPTGERVIRQPFANHNGGNLVFGPDGYLYIGLGDGGSGNDPENNAQNPGTLLGKMLRIDVAVGDDDQIGYRVPADNPFVDGQPVPALGEIWAFGLRNPWRYSFDDVGAGATGALIIGDVGQGAREEINYEPAGRGGRNYGWRLREGRIPAPGAPAGSAPAFGPLTEPILDYPRSVGQAVTGGYVYRGSALGPAYVGRYFFADFVSARVWSVGLALDGAGEATVTDVIEHTGELGVALTGIASFGRDLAGELYLLTFGGDVVKLVPAGAGTGAAPTDLTASVNGSTVVLSWQVPAGVAPIAYQLEAGSAPGATDIVVMSTQGAATSFTVSGVPPGVYYVRVRSLGSGGAGAPSNEAVVVVDAAGCTQPPAAPTGLAATVAGGVVTLSWAQGEPSSAFQVEAGSVSGASDLAVVSVSGAQTGLVAQAPPGAYFVRVRSANACGVSAASNEILVTVP